MVYVSGTTHNRAPNLLGKYALASSSITGAFYDSETRNTYIGQSQSNSSLYEKPGGTLQFDTTTGELFGIIDDPGGYWVEDGSGGYYLYNNSNASYYLTRIDINKKTVTGWTNPTLAQSAGSTPSVSKVIRDGSTLYICGNFTSVNGSARAGIAALNSDTGALLSWNPGGNATYVYNIVSNIAGTIFYVTGNFTTIGGQTRSQLAAITISTALATAWNPAPNAFVGAVNIDETNNVAYIGGSFTTVGGTARLCLAQVSLASTGALQAWNPSVSGGVSPSVVTILTTGTTTKTVYFGGSFTTVGGNSRSNLASWTAPSGGGVGAVTTLSLATVGVNVRTLAISGSTLYVGLQNQSTVGATSVGPLFSVDVTTNAIVNSYSHLIGTGAQIDVSGSVLSVYVARSPKAAITNTSLFCIDSGGKLTSFRCAAPGVYAMVKKGNTLYIGGSFTTVNGTSRVGLAAVDATTGALLSSSMELGPSSVIYALTLYGDTLLVGGQFTAINNTNCNGFARVDTTTNTGTGNTYASETSFGTDSIINSIVVNGSIGYISGYFDTYTGPSLVNQTRYGAAAINLATYELTSWDPAVYDSASDQAATNVRMSLNEAGTKMYIWGQFDTAKFNTVSPVSVPGKIIRVDLTTGQTIDSVSSSFTGGENYKGMLEKNGIAYVAASDGSAPGGGFYGRDATTGTLVTSTTTFLSVTVVNPSEYKPLHSISNGILAVYPVYYSNKAILNMIKIFDTNTMSERY